jgi:hypothetical protein
VSAASTSTAANTTESVTSVSQSPTDKLVDSHCDGETGKVAVTPSTVVLVTVPAKSPVMSPGRGGVGFSPGASPGRSMEDGSFRSSLKRSLSPGHSIDYTASKRLRTRQDGFGSGQCRKPLCG